MRQLMRTAAPHLLVAVLALAVGGCKTRVTNINIGTSQAEVFAITVGPGGGTLVVDDESSPAFGTEIEVPPDAVPENTELSVRPAAQPPAGPLGLRPTGPVLLVRFTSVRKPVTVRLPFRLDLSSEEAPIISRYGEDEAAWSSSIASPLADGTRRLEVTTEKFGWFFTGGQGVGDGGASDGGQLIDSATSVDTLPEDQVPPTFEGLDKAEVVGQGMARLSWKAGSDDRTTAENLRYRLYLPSFAVLGAPQGETPPGVIELTLPVQPGVPYYFLVRAVDEAGNEDSNLQVVTLRVPVVFDGGPDADVGGGDVPTDTPVDGAGPPDGPDLQDGPAPDGKQTVGLQVPSSATLNEGGTPGIIRVNRSSSSGPLTVRLNFDPATTVTVTGTGGALPDDYRIDTTAPLVESSDHIQVTFLDGQSSIDLMINALVDTHAEDDETLGLYVVADALVAPDSQAPVAFLTILGGGTDVVHLGDDFNTYRFREGSLRLAMERSIAAGSGTIDVQVAGTVQMVGPLPTVIAGTTVQITAPFSSLALQANSAFRIIDVDGTLIASNLQFVNGFEPMAAGAALVAGTLNCSSCIFSGNRASVGEAIFLTAGASVTLTGCTISGNLGGTSAIDNSVGGPLFLSNDTFSNNAGANVLGPYSNGGGNSPANP